MNIVIVTVPLRSRYDGFTPFGSLAILQSLRAVGEDPYFYDIDCLRPSFDEVEEFFRRRQPEVVGISAVVSTGYAYVKRLGLMLKRVVPDARVVLGGNLAASAELLLRRCGIDVCVLGDGERKIRRLVDCYRRGPKGDDDEQLAGIPGLVFVNRQGQLINTGFDTKTPDDLTQDPDYSILEEYSDIRQFVRDPGVYFTCDARSREPHRAGKKEAMVFASKGCTHRCTFCHRWEKGFTRYGLDRITRRIRYLVDNYNVGFIRFADESFGSDRKTTAALVDWLRGQDLLWQVTAARVSTVDQETLRAWRDAGCTCVIFGMESGSKEILKVMEKGVSLEHNYNVVRWTAEAGLYSVCQLVIAMPGENDATIAETSKFLNYFTREQGHATASVNYAMALPGTPLYEYARAKDILAPTPDDEERYLLWVSDCNAGDADSMINYTSESFLTVRRWQHTLYVNMWKQHCLDDHREPAVPWQQAVLFLARHVLGRGCSRIAHAMLRALPGGDWNQDLPFGDPRNIGRHPLLFLLRRPLLFLWVLKTSLREAGVRKTLSRLGEHVLVKARRIGQRRRHETVGLRQVLKEIMPEAREPAELAMAPLRMGR